MKIDNSGRKLHTLVCIVSSEAPLFICGEMYVLCVQRNQRAFLISENVAKMNQRMSEILGSGVNLNRIVRVCVLYTISNMCVFTEARCDQADRATGSTQ